MFSYFPSWHPPTHTSLPRGSLHNQTIISLHLFFLKSPEGHAGKNEQDAACITALFACITHFIPFTTNRLNTVKLHFFHLKKDICIYGQWVKNHHQLKVLRLSNPIYILPKCVMQYFESSKTRISCKDSVSLSFENVNIYSDVCPGDRDRTQTIQEQSTISPVNSKSQGWGLGWGYITW